MNWQDIVISIANIMFSSSVVYQVYYGFKKKKGLITLTTAIMTIIGLIAIAITFFTLSLHFSAIISIISAFFWLILFIQRIVFKKA